MGFCGEDIEYDVGAEYDATEAREGLWNEVVGRSGHAKRLILDMTGQLNGMCPDDYGRRVEFGENILEITRRIP